MKTLLDREGREIEDSSLVLSRVWAHTGDEYWEPCVCFYLPARPDRNPNPNHHVCWLEPNGRALDGWVYSDTGLPRDYLLLPARNKNVTEETRERAR